MGGRIASLDGLRGIAIGLVLLAHHLIYANAPGLRQVGLAAGFTGVTLFFVLSGYLITSLLLDEERRMGSLDLRLFYIRRALRLFPALWAYLAVLAGFWMVGRLPDHPWHSFVASLLYVRNLVGHGYETDHLWSLSIEEQFYLLWPVALWALPRRDGPRLGLAIGAIACVTAWRVYATSTELASAGALYIRSDFRFDAPLIGCALALAERLAPRVVEALATPLRSGALALVGLVSLGAFVWYGSTDAPLPGLAATWVALATTMIVVSQRASPNLLGRVLAWTPLAVLGRLSYGVYLWQQLFLGPATATFGELRQFPWGLGATFGAATASYWLIERPLLALKDRHFQRAGNTAAANASDYRPTSAWRAMDATSDAGGAAVRRAAPPACS